MNRAFSRKNKVSLRFVKRDDRIVLMELKGPGNVEFENVATFRLADLEHDQIALLRLLEEYQCHPNAKKLEKLVRECNRAYKNFLCAFEVESARRWWSEVVRDRGSINAPILELTVLDTLTIPFGLYYVGDVNADTDWNQYEVVVRGFMGVNFPIHKIYRRRMRLQTSIVALCNDEPPRVLHSIDSSLPCAEAEADTLAGISSHVTTPSTKPQLVKYWTDVALPPHVVHCSCHLRKDQEKRSYLSCCTDERLYAHDLRDAEVTMPLPPFVFLNSCQGGFVTFSDRDNFIWLLFPAVASGFVATMCEVADDMAEQMAGHFYRNFFGGAEVLLALHEAIRTVVVDKGRLAGLAYVLWESDPHLVLGPD